MKLIEAIVAPERLNAVKESLGQVEVHRMSVADVTGLEAVPEGASGGPFTAQPRVRIEIAVNEDFVRPTLEAIRAAFADAAFAEEDGADGRDGGRIFVHPLHDVIRVRTGERGPEAI